MKIDHDLHVHTYFSGCCSEKKTQRPEFIVKKAESLGLKTIGLNDHLWIFDPDQQVEIRDAQKKAQKEIDSPVKILVGGEADTLAPGKFSITREHAETLDYVGLSCTHFHLKDYIEQAADDKPLTIAKHMMKFFISAVQSGFATTIVHPLKPYGYAPIYEEVISSISDNEFIDALSLAAENNVALEITPSFLPPKPNPEAVKPVHTFSIETPLRVLLLAKQSGCKFTFGSDAHKQDSMDRILDLDIFIKKLDLTKEDIAPIVR